MDNSSGNPGCLKTIWYGIVVVFAVGFLVLVIDLVAQWSPVVAGVMAFGCVVGGVIGIKGNRRK